MKVRVLIVVLVVALAVPPLMVTFAQGGEEEINIPEDLGGTLVQTADGGTFAINDDGSYLLTLQAAKAFNPLFVQTPSVSIGRYITSELADDWSFSVDELNLDMQVAAMLNLPDMNLTLTLTDPVYDPDAGTFTWTAVVVEIVSFEEEKDEQVPEEFTDGILYLMLDSAFVTDLQAGRTLRLETLRPTGVQQTCIPGVSCR